MVDYPDHRCPVCKGPMAEQKTSACSGRCRAAWSRRRRSEEIEAALEEVEKALRKVRQILCPYAEY